MDRFEEIVFVDPNKIIVANRWRSLDHAWVEVLSTSINQQGQITPIQVRRNGGGKLHLIAGAHRLQACNDLGCSIRAEVLACTEDEASLIEIFENLHRRELGALDRAISLYEGKNIHEKLHPETRKGGKNQHTKDNLPTDTMSFSKEVAERTGFSPRTIERSIYIAANIPKDIIKRISGTPLAEKQSDLLYLASLNPSIQRKAVTLVGDGTAKSLKGAVDAIEGSVVPELTAEDRQFKKLVSAWFDAKDDVKKNFLAHLRELGEIK